MPYKISTTQKRSVLESTEWLKDGHKISVVDVCRWGWIEVENKPDLSGYDTLKGIEVFSSFDVQNYETETDGFDEEIQYSKSMSTKDKNKIKRFLEESSITELGELGWEQGPNKTIFRGPLDVEKI